MIHASVSACTLVLAFRSASALQLAPPTSNSFRGCSLIEETSFEQNLYGGGDVQSLTQNRICDSYEASQGLHGMTFANFSNSDDNDSVIENVSRVIWVSGYPRSGSSTALSLVSATMDDNRAGTSQTFSIFEPCHDGDVYADWQRQEGCSSVLYNLAHCDFHGIRALWGWSDPHTTTGDKSYKADQAHDMCVNSQVVAFKTVDYGHDLKAWKWFLDSSEKIRVLDVVRDPRGIYSSWKTMEPFASLIKKGDFYTIPEVCSHFAKNLDFKDDRVHRIVFEELVANPFNVTYEAYKFMGLNFGKKQKKWIQRVFNAKWCPPPDPNMDGFTDCHVNSEANAAKEAEHWRDVLTQTEQHIFKNNPHCRRIAKEYGYPLS